jgi:hypothetical protein
MGSIVLITLYDDDAHSADPVIYDPKSVVAGIASWIYPGNTAAGAREFTFSYSDATSARPTEKIRGKLRFPKEVQNADLTYSVVSTAFANIEVTIPSGWTQAEREDLSNNLATLFDPGKPLHNAIHDGDRVYG